MLMPQGHRRPVQDGKIYETTGRDKGIATVEHPTTGTTPPTAGRETRSKRIAGAARFRGINCGQNWFELSPIQNRLSVVKRMKCWMIKIAGGHKKFGLAEERFLHDKSYQIFQPMGIL